MANWESGLQMRLRFTLAIAATPVFFASSIIGLEPHRVTAQTTPTASTYKLPNSLPSGTTLTVDGSSSMTVMNESLKKRFQEKFPGSTVNIAAIGTDEALKFLKDAKVDLVAVGRSLTPAEKAKGLVEAPISREKVAIIVGSNNSFRKSLTLEQFAKIFRGEITDWSQVGGTPGPIRMVDRPKSSDTRQALSQYTVFQGKPFEAGGKTTTVAEDSTAAVIKELGNDGIGYAIADQVVNQPNVTVLPLHETLPTDPRYPFSQHRGYVYQGEPNPSTVAFLGLATSKPGQEVVQAGNPTETNPTEANPTEAKDAKPAIATPNAVASPTGEPTVSPSVEPTVASTVEPVGETQTSTSSPSTSSPSTTAVANTAAEPRPFPWWWLLLPLVGLGGLLALMKGRMSADPMVAPVAAVEGDRSRIILTPRDCQNAYAYWELSEDQKQIQSQGGHNLALRLYDVTKVDRNGPAPQNLKQFDVDKNEQDYHLTIALDDRDYVAELGYVDEKGEWVKVARSEPVRVPACTPEKRIGTAATAVAGLVAPAGVGAASMGAIATSAALGKLPDAEIAPEPLPAVASDPSRIILVPRDANSAYAYWEVPDEHKADLRQQGGETLTLRVHDVTDIDFDQHPAHSTQQHPCDESATDQQVPISRSDRDYIADLGYLTQDDRWLRLAKSDAVRVPAARVEAQPVSGSYSAAATAAVTQLFKDVNQAVPPVSMPDNLTNRLDSDRLESD